MAQVGKGDDAIKSVDEAQQLSKGSASPYLSSITSAQAHLLQVLPLLHKLMNFWSGHSCIPHLLACLECTFFRLGLLVGAMLQLSQTCTKR